MTKRQISKKHKHFRQTLNHTEHQLYTELSLAFSSIATTAATMKICAITAGIKIYMPIIKKKKKKNEKILLLTKSKLNAKHFLIFKDLVDSNISHDEFISTDNVLKGYDDMKGKKSDKIKWVFIVSNGQCLKKMKILK